MNVLGRMVGVGLLGVMNTLHACREQGYFLMSLALATTVF